MFPYAHAVALADEIPDAELLPPRTDRPRVLPTAHLGQGRPRDPDVVPGVGVEPTSPEGQSL